MPAPEVEEFVGVLIAHVRDMAISTSDMSLDEDANGPIARRWRHKMRSGQPRELALEMIPDCVDNTLFYLLDAIDQGLLRVSFTASSGKTVDLTDLGESEMSGWYMATDGWRHAYSKERLFDDLDGTE